MDIRQTEIALPWAYPTNVPTVSKNWTAAEQKKCVKAANAVLRDGGTEQDAIFACIRAAGKTKEKKQSMAKRRTLAATDADKDAQKARSRRYGIGIRKDGSITKPSQWKNVADSQWGDPVNYAYPVPDKAHAANAKSRFAQHSGKYDTKSRGVVRGRLNRLLRKYGLEPIEGSDTRGVVNASVDYVGEILLQVPDEETGLVRIPTIRASTYKHWYYGDLHFDNDLFESLVDNWESNVLGYDVSLNQAHDRYSEALGWIKHVEIEDGDLVLYAEPTEAGEGKLGDSLRYASMEFNSNYVDSETGISYGPVLCGVAATNYPFIHRQDAITVLSRDIEVPNYNEDVMVVLSDHVLAPVPKHVVQMCVNNPEVEPDEEEVSTESEELTNEEVTMPENTEQTDQTVQPTAQTDQNTQPADRIVVQGTVVTSEQVEEILRDQRKLRDRLQEMTVREICEKAASRGVVPAVTDMARQVMMACDMNAEATVKMSMPADEADKTVNLFWSVAEILNVVPGRSLDEVTHSDTGEQPPENTPVNEYTDRKDVTPEEAEKIANDRRAFLRMKPVKLSELEV